MLKFVFKQVNRNITSFVLRMYIVVQKSTQKEIIEIMIFVLVMLMVMNRIDKFYFFVRR